MYSNIGSQNGSVEKDLKLRINIDLGDILNVGSSNSHRNFRAMGDKSLDDPLVFRTHKSDENAIRAFHIELVNG